MAIKFACEACGASLKVPEAKAGARGKCPKCHAAIVVPELSEPEEDEAESPWEDPEGPWSDEDFGDVSAAPPVVRKPGKAGKRTGTQSSRYVYQSKTGLVWAITILMGIFILSMLGYGAASLYQLGLLQQLQAGQDVDQQTLVASDTMVAAPACIQVLAVLSIALLWCFWKPAANRNARAISGKDLEYTPGWTVGCYFVPFANLVWPYNAMKEIWENSNPSAPAGLVGVWWGLWIVNGIVSRVESQMAMRAESVEEFISATYVSLVTVPLALASAGAALAVVWKVHGLQEQAASRA